MPKSHFPGILMLGLTCLLAVACQTTGSPPQSKAIAQPPAPPASSTAGAQPVAPPASSTAAAQPAAPSLSAEAAAQPPAPVAADSAGQSGTEKHTGGAVPRGSALKERTVSMRARLGGLFAGQTTGTTRAIEYAAAAGVIVLAVGAIATVSARRHRKLTPSSPESRR